MEKLKVYCLLTTGEPLTPETSRLLFCTAQELIRNGKRKKKIKSSDCEGVISTRFKFEYLNSWVMGIQFLAELETDTGMTKVTYIVRKTDLNPDQLAFADLPPGHPLAYPENPVFN